MVQWELENQFVILTLQSVFPTDSVNNIAALTSTASTSSDAKSKFNTITYNKGASVIRMMEHFMGSANFTYGMRAYLKAQYMMKIFKSIQLDFYNHNVLAKIKLQHQKTFSMHLLLLLLTFPKGELLKMY